MCNKIFGFVQYNKAVRGIDCIVDESGEVHTEKVHRSIFFHSPDLYNMYDTYATIDRTNFDFDWEGKYVQSSTRAFPRARNTSI